jgi:hypothetical protein
MHSSQISKGFHVTVAPAAGTSADNPFTATGLPERTFPTAVIESDGPGIDVPVWYETPETPVVEIEITGALVTSIEIPGPTSIGPGPQPAATVKRTGTGDFIDDDGVRVWFHNGTTWEEHEWSPIGAGWNTGCVFDAPVSRIRLTDIDRTATDPADNVLPVGLFFDGASTGVTLAMTGSRDTPTIAPVLLLLED